MAHSWCLSAALATLLLTGHGASAADDAAAGQKLAQAVCGPCHAMTRARPGADAGMPTLGAVADRPGTTRQSVMRLVQGPHMSGLNLPPDKASDIAAYVMSLRGQ